MEFQIGGSGDQPDSFPCEKEDPWEPVQCLAAAKPRGALIEYVGGNHLEASGVESRLHPGEPARDVLPDRDGQLHLHESGLIYIYPSRHGVYGGSRIVLRQSLICSMAVTRGD